MFVDIHTSSKQYKAEVGPGILREAGKTIETLAPASSYLIVSDENVANRYLDVLVSSFTKVPHTFVVKAGEQSKSFHVYEQLAAFCLEKQLDRQSVIIAFGGGVVGDLAGFVAGTYMRGIRFIQVPTTLLAHDSSVGGKVAVNLPAAKNMIGVFHQPEAVLFDTELLATLPDDEWRSGFAEIVKLGFIADAPFLAWLRETVLSLTSVKADHLQKMVAKAIAIKADIVGKDEKEHGIRAHLNFGHTLAHAIEAELGYGKVTHGEAVAIGMRFAFRLSLRFTKEDLRLADYENWFSALGYDLRLPAGLSAQRLLARMKSDKKTNAGKIVMVLLEQLGAAYTKTVDEHLLLELLEDELGGRS
ncbi:3-dehydroquinate synthase [Shouchella tritolerans]|uniref:3-dehydroquinate synthase n=1 Tax=Shouchella tritolerans TaxID=2979466 RepID=UPI0021E7422C|nr:3-dehydroquinate synthase [Shouchella tritolerans]